jgi:hypothetical protein
MLGSALFLRVLGVFNFPVLIRSVFLPGDIDPVDR